MREILNISKRLFLLQNYKLKLSLFIHKHQKKILNKHSCSKPNYVKKIDEQQQQRKKKMNKSKSKYLKTKNN